MNHLHETKTYNLFPTLVVQDPIDVHESFKTQYLEKLKKEWFDGYKNESPENSGKSMIHLNVEYSEFFQSLKKSIEKYLKILSVDVSKVSIHITKSWVGYHNKDIPALKVHNHNAADISFCYYLQSDETSDLFCVHPIKNNNEISGGLFEPSEQNPILTETNTYNCNAYSIVPLEGTVLIFPSCLPHSTIKRKNLRDRYVIAGDVKVTLKPQFVKQVHSIPHPSQWLELE